MNHPIIPRIQGVATLRLALALAPCLATSAALEGCAAAALAPMVAQGGSLVNGSSGNKIQVTLDDKTFTPQVRSTLLSAKHWAVAAVGRSDIKMIDLLESRGGFAVNVDRPVAAMGEMTGSERHDALQKMCASHESDVALMTHRGETQTGNTLLAAVTGRATVNATATMEVLDCHAHTPYSFAYTVTFDMGIWSHQPKGQMEDAVASETANALLVALGK